jgi:hypothetical protein
MSALDENDNKLEPPTGDARELAFYRDAMPR